jgi:hypothetical protein
MTVLLATGSPHGTYVRCHLSRNNAISLAPTVLIQAGRRYRGRQACGELGSMDVCQRIKPTTAATDLI